MCQKTVINFRRIQAESVQRKTPTHTSTMLLSKSVRSSIRCSPIFGQYVIFLVVLSMNVCHPLHTLEQPVRESLLRPRSYNPHPYQAYHHHSQSDQLLDGLNAIDSGAENYVGSSVFGFNGLGQAIGSSLPARHPSNGLYRCTTFSNNQTFSHSLSLPNPIKAHICKYV